MCCETKFIHYTGATYFKKMLMENKKLQHLNIGGNEIGDDGVRHVTEGLQKNNTLTKLLLWGCEISVKGRLAPIMLLKLPIICSRNFFTHYSLIIPISSLIIPSLFF